MLEEKPILTSEEKALLVRSQKMFNRVTVFSVLIGVALFFHWAPDRWFEKAATETIMAEIDPMDTLVIDGIHVQSGLVVDSNFVVVKSNCTNCHSGRLIAQNRATREGWKEMIVWMQETQGLWDLGESEETILNYLALHYAPKKAGRRAPLTNIEWYELEE